MITQDSATALADGESPDDGHTHESACLNCGTALIGSHCHACGQAAHVHRTIGAFLHDLLHGVFHFEGRIWRTLPELALRPGKLTREYVDGRRASYISPIALFLFCVFLLFAVAKETGGPIAFNPTTEINGVSASVKPGGAGSAVPAAPVSNVPAIDQAVRRFQANPGLAVYKLQTYAYKYSWALIPISVPFVWLLFPFSRRFGLYDHTVFVTYSLCFMTLLVILLMLGEAVGVPAIGALAVIVPPFHIYRQLRGTYGVGRGGALWRTAALLGIALTALMLFGIILLAET